MSNTCGGIGTEKAPDDISQKAVSSVISRIKEKISYDGNNWKVISYSSQLVNGTNFFVKILLNNEYILARIHRSLQKEYNLIALIRNQPRDKPIHYFESQRIPSEVANGEISLNFVYTNGIRLRYAESGPLKAPTILFMHGWPETWYSWRHQITFFAKKGFHIIAPDMPGYGGSDAPMEVSRYSCHRMAEYMNGLLDSLNIKNVILVGHDWGAVLTWFFALIAPKRFTALIALSVPPPLMMFGCWSKISPMTFYRNLFKENFFYMIHHNEYNGKYGQPWPVCNSKADATYGAAEKDYDKNIESILRSLYFNGTQSSVKDLKIKSMPVIKDKHHNAGGWSGRLPIPAGEPNWCPINIFHYYVSEFQRTGFRGGLNHYRCMEYNWEWSKRFPKDTMIQQPVLFIAGAKDMVVSRLGKDGVKKILRGKCKDLRDFLWLKDAGHWCQQEKHELINTTILDFLCSLDLIVPKL